jgi:hypothetical protein
MTAVGQRMPTTTAGSEQNTPPVSLIKNAVVPLPSVCRHPYRCNAPFRNAFGQMDRLEPLLFQ